MDRNGSKLTEKEKLHVYGIDKSVLVFSVKLYFINTTSEKSSIFMINLMKAS